MKLNPSSQIESIKVTLTPETFPIAFKNKVDELMEQGAFESREEAQKWVRETPIELELYYDKHSGLFAVESDALEGSASSICSPYNPTDFFEDDDE